MIHDKQAQQQQLQQLKAEVELRDSQLSEQREVSPYI